MDEFAYLYVPSGSKTLAQDWAELEFGSAQQRGMFNGRRVSVSGVLPATGWVSHVQTNPQRRSRLTGFASIAGTRWARVDIDTLEYRGGDMGGSGIYPVDDFLSELGVQFIPAR